MLAEVCFAPVHGVEAYPVKADVDARYGETLIVMIVSISPIATFAVASPSGCGMSPSADVAEGFNRQPRSFEAALLIVLAGQVCQCWAMSTTAFGRERKLTLPANVFGAADLRRSDRLEWRLEDGEIRGCKME
jgi:hypothetical protein